MNNNFRRKSYYAKYFENDSVAKDIKSTAVNNLNNKIEYDNMPDSCITCESIKKSELEEIIRLLKKIDEYHNEQGLCKCIPNEENPCRTGFEEVKGIFAKIDGYKLSDAEMGRGFKDTHHLMGQISVQHTPDVKEVKEFSADDLREDIYNKPVEAPYVEIKYNDYPFEDDPAFIKPLKSEENIIYNDNPYEDDLLVKIPDTAEESVLTSAIPMAFVDESASFKSGIVDLERESVTESAAVNEDFVEVKEIEIPDGLKPYDRKNAVEYAYKWALSRNPDYFNFDEIGGDCTNYVSQILHAGGCMMNFTPTYGWYYKTASNKSASWTGVEYLYNFLTKNTGTGPVAIEVDISQVEPGDIVQLSFNGKEYQHSPVIVKVSPNPSKYEDIFICAHTIDCENRNLNSYIWRKVRFLKILGHR